MTDGSDETPIEPRRTDGVAPDPDNAPDAARALYAQDADAEDERDDETDAAEVRRASQRAGIAAARRKRFLQVAPWVAVGLLVVAGLAAAVAALTTGASPLPSTGGATVPADLAVAATLTSTDATVGGAIGVAVSGDRVYIAESRKGFVRVVTREGSAVATIGAGWLRTPVYVAVGPVDGRVYVSDRGRGEVGVFSATGEFFGVLTPQGLAERTPAGSWLPLAMGFAPEGALYVADSSGLQSIAVFSAAGSRIGTLGADVPEGRSGTRFAFPNGITVSARKVLVADSNNGRLLVFDRSGAFEGQIAVDGIPRGVALLGDGRIVLTAASRDAVRVLDAQGAPAGTVAGQAGAPSPFVAPAGLALGEDGTLYVADSVTGEISIVRTGVVSEGRSGLLPESRVGLLVLTALLLALAVALGWRAVSRASARVRETGIRL